MRKMLPVALSLALAVAPAAMAESPDLSRAESGDAQAQYELAEYYYTQERDFTKAAEWMTKAAEQGVPEAQLKLGLMYYSGECGEVDISEAMRWWQCAADQGNTEAMRYLGYVYEQNNDAETAVTYYQEAAELGDAEAQYTMGYCYASGIGVPKNEETSVEYYAKAASNGDKEAQMQLGMQYYTEGNYDRAVIYLEAAAAQGEDTAQYTLGYMYANGQGVPQDSEQAKDWWTQAGRNGNKDAVLALYSLKKGDEPIEVLTKGVVTEDVKTVQQALATLGYYTGEVTGTYDDVTESAVMAFQKAHSLEATGTVDPETRAYIDFQDLDFYVAKVDFVSLQNADAMPRLFVSFKNTGEHTITQIVFQVVPLDSSDDPMAVYDSYESISFTSERTLAPGASDQKGYYWTLNGCNGVRGVKLAISSITFEDGTQNTLNDGELNWITYSYNG